MLASSIDPALFVDALAAATDVEARLPIDADGNDPEEGGGGFDIKPKCGLLLLLAIAGVEGVPMFMRLLLKFAVLLLLILLLFCMVLGLLHVLKILILLLLLVE